MSVYMTEQEQIEMLKGWWKKYSNLVTIVLSVVLLAIAGFRYWTWHEQKVTLQASNTYERLMVAFSNDDKKAVRGLANELINTYDKTVYADAAHLVLAKFYSAKEQYPQAKNELSKVIAHTKMLDLKAIASIRLARLLMAEGAYQEAFDELSKVKDSSYLPAVNEVKGDIHAALKQFDKATLFYQLANNEIKNKGITNTFLDLKLREVLALHPDTSMQKKG